MDRLIVSLLNTAGEDPDPLDSPLGAARWWGRVQAEVRQIPRAIAAKPRFDLRLCEALKAHRSNVSALLRGEARAPEFTSLPGADAVLFPLAYAVARLLAQDRGTRIKPCARASCGRLFLDETKNGSRRWCSMRCMERARAPRRRTIAG